MCFPVSLFFYLERRQISLNLTNNSKDFWILKEERNEKERGRKGFKYLINGYVFSCFSLLLFGKKANKFKLN
jgi:hypothetical protein